MANLTREQVTSYSRRRIWAPFVILLWPPLGMLAGALGGGTVVYLWNLAGQDPESAPAIVGFFLGALPVMVGVFYLIHRLTRCPSCGSNQMHRWQFKRPYCGSCGQPFTAEEFDNRASRQEVEAGHVPPAPLPPPGAPRRATNDELRVFYEKYRRLRRLFWAFQSISIPAFFVFLFFVGRYPESTGEAMPFIVLPGMLVNVGLILYFRQSCACPHCGSKGVGMRALHPFVGKPTCPRCDGPLEPTDDLPDTRQESGVPYGRN